MHQALGPAGHADLISIFLNQPNNCQIMNKIIPIVGIAAGIGIIAIIALISTSSINYTSMNCDEIRKEMDSILLAVPQYSQSVKEYLEKTRILSGLNVEKNCGYFDLNLDTTTNPKPDPDPAIQDTKTTMQDTETTVQDIDEEINWIGMDFDTDNFYTHIYYGHLYCSSCVYSVTDSGATSIKNMIEKRGLFDIKTSKNMYGAYVSLNSDSYNVGDVIDGTVVFKRDLRSIHDGLYDLPVGISDEWRMQLSVSLHYGGILISDDFKYVKNDELIDDAWFGTRPICWLAESNSEIVTYQFSAGTEECILNEDGSLSFKFTISDNLLEGLDELSTGNKFKIKGYAHVNTPSDYWSSKTVPVEEFVESKYFSIVTDG